MRLPLVWPTQAEYRADRPLDPVNWSDLDSNNRVVRGAAVVQLNDIADSEVDVYLTPESYPRHAVVGRSTAEWRLL